MAIFLRHSYNIPPVRWGSPANVQYAVQKNCEQIYGIDSDRLIFTSPMWERYGDVFSDLVNPHRAGSLKNGAVFNDQGIVLDDAFSQYSEIGIGTDYTPAKLGVFVKFNANNWTDADANKVHIVSKPFRGFFLRCTEAIPYFYFLNSVTWYEVHGTSALSTHRDHTLFGTYDLKDQKIYVDGEEADTKSIELSILYATAQPLRFGRDVLANGRFFDGTIKCSSIFDFAPSADQVALFNDLPYGLYQKVSRPVYLLQAAPGPFTEFSDLNTEISGGSESLQDLITDIQASDEIFFDLETEISATTVQTILDLNTEIAAAFNISFEDLNTDIQAVARSYVDLNTEISANSDFVFYDLNTEIKASKSSLYDLNTEIITNAQIVSDLNTDIRARGDTFYDLNTDIQAISADIYYDLSIEISAIRSKYWLDTEVEALSYARWSFNTEWDPNRFLNTDIAAKKPYTFSFKTKTGSSYTATSSEIEILLSGYSWPLRTLFLDYLRVGTSNVYNFELWWARGQVGKKPLKNAKIKAEYVNTQFSGGYEVVTCDWLTCSIDGGAEQTINATPLDLGDMPCDSKLDIELTVDCRDCSLTRGLVFFRLIVTGDYQEALYGAPVVYGDGTQYFEGTMDDYESNNFICRLYVVG